MSPKPVKESKKRRKEASETTEETPRLRLKDFSTLAKELSPTKESEEIIELSDEEDSRDEAERASEERDLKRFQCQVNGFLAELYKKSNSPDEHLQSSLASKLYNESVETYRANNGTAIGIAMTREVKRLLLSCSSSSWKSEKR